MITRRLFSLVIGTILGFSLFGQQAHRVPGPGGYKPGGGGSSPTLVGTPVVAVTNFSVGPYTLNVGNVNANDIVHYHVRSAVNADTFTVTDNCNSGGSSDTNVVHTGSPQSYSGHGTDQEGHLVVGANTTGCTISITNATGQFGTAAATVIRGSSGLDVFTNPMNQQLSPGTGTDAFTSGSAITTNFADFCVGTVSDHADTAGTFSAGTGWTLGANESSNGSITEYKTQGAAGAIQATATYTNTSSASQFGLACYKP